ncbi:response regulator [Flavobacteriaceae bacterium AU392]|nr:DNA-binding response regulator [Flavobacteriaceae bacterium]RKM85123.1 response regulator [Flavobacteriaceae bacterium AU392]
MTKLYNVLIIDDHPLIVDSYKNALLDLSSNNETIEFKIDTADNCDSAYMKIKEIPKNNPIDIIFLDIKLPHSKDRKILSGEDLGIKIRQLLPDIKIVVSTTYNDNYRVNSIFKSIDPDGFLVKSDLNPEILKLAIQTIIKSPPFYSRTVVQLMRKLTSNDFLLDAIDRKILYELSHGAKMSELPNILPLSIAAIERRKRILKEVFNVVGKGDRNLFKIAEEKGFI